MALTPAEFAQQAFQQSGGAFGVNPATAGPAAVAAPSVIAGGINFGSAPSVGTGAKTVDDVVKAAIGPAKGILRSGAQDAQALTLSGAAGLESRLSQFLRPQALEEQAALLGAGGAEAQRAAIAGIPVSAAQAEADRRERVGQQRRAAAGGDLGSGATLLGAGQLAGQQQANIIGGRINQLEQLAGIDRGILSDISRSREAAGSRVAALQQGLGSQLSNIGFGLTAPIVQSIQTQADITGLRGISRAGASAQRSSQIANLAGQVFTPQNIQGVAGLFSSPAPTPATSISQNLNFNQGFA